MTQTFRLTQVNGLSFRAEMLKVGEKKVLWIAESEEEIYSFSFDYALSADVYQPDSTQAMAKALLLYLDDDEVHTIEIGTFTPEDAVKFLTWLQSALL